MRLLPFVGKLDRLGASLACLGCRRRRRICNLFLTSLGVAGSWWSRQQLSQLMVLLLAARQPRRAAQLARRLPPLARRQAAAAREAGQQRGHLPKDGPLEGRGGLVRRRQLGQQALGGLLASRALTALAPRIPQQQAPASGSKISKAVIRAGSERAAS